MAAEGFVGRLPLETLVTLEEVRGFRRDELHRDGCPKHKKPAAFADGFATSCSPVGVPGFRRDELRLRPFTG